MNIEKPSFKRICLMHIQALTNFPYIEKDFDALTDYELLCKVVDYLNQVITNTNEQNTAITDLYDAFIELKDYVDNYFNNNFPELVNDKLDEMAEDGTLENLLHNKLKLITTYHSFTDVIEDKNTLSNGMIIKTLGYYTINDGGAATYYITNTASETEYQEDFENGLYATLIVESEVNVKQFGVYGDGEHDDTIAFQKCLNLQKNIKLKENDTYLLTSNIDLPKYVHIEGNKATIKYEYNGSREHQIRNANWLNSNDELNSLYLNNINFYVNSTNRQIKLIGLSDYEKIVITNCNYSNNLNNTSGSWFIDLYSNCSNVLIDNINVETLTTNENLYNTCIGIREYRASKTSKNIKIINSNFIHNGLDETIWNDSWYGTISDVIYDNCFIHDKSTTDLTFLWIGSNNDNNSVFKNVLINNCYLLKDKITTAGIKFGYNGNTDNNNCTNFIMQNCKIDIESGSGQMFNGSRYSDDCFIRNCIINYNSTEDINTTSGYVQFGNFKNYNNIFNIKGNGSNNRFAFAYVKEMIDCQIKLNNGHAFNPSIELIKNCIIDGCLDLFQAQNINYDINLLIENSIIKTNEKMFNSVGISNNKVITVNNCDLTLKAGEAVDYMYGVTSSLVKTVLFNTNINSSGSLILTNTTGQQEKLYITNCTFNNNIISGIPLTDANRGFCVIGTVFDGGAGHSVVRKISAGLATTNWETI